MSETIQPALSIRGLRHGYQDFELGPLDLELEPGLVLALVGPNGAGKTTTLDFLAGLRRPDAGTIEVFGRRNDPAHPEWRHDVGVVGEEHGFYGGWTAAQNLRFLSRFYPRWSERRVEALARRFELPLEKKVRALSKGGRAKLALVAALGHAPRLLLLDEPTSGLDPVVRTEVLDALWEVLEDGERAILYSTHGISDVARLADELAFLKDGRLVLRETKDALVDTWRRISCRLEAEVAALPGAAGHRRSGRDHQWVSHDPRATLAELRRLGAESIRETRMTLDEITVEILKGGHDVAADPR